MNFNIDLDPRTRDELLAALDDARHQVYDTCAGADPEAFFRRPADAWSGADHLAHLVTSVNAIAKGLTMNRFMLRLLFGRSSAGSRSFAGVRDAYHALLAAGGRAGGRFVPRQEAPPAEESAARAAREALLARWQRASTRLVKGLERWDLEALDRFRLPHPLLGKLTVREMLFFTIYHNLHHAHRMRELTTG